MLGALEQYNERVQGRSSTLPDLSELAGRSESLGFLAFYPQISTATGNVMVTATLAIMAMLYYHGCGIWEQGLFTYIKNIVPVTSVTDAVKTNEGPGLITIP